MNFTTLLEFTEHLKTQMIFYIRQAEQFESGFFDKCIIGPQFILAFIYGSQNYHPEYAKDYDIGIVVSSEVQSVFNSVFHKEQKKWTFNGYPVDIKVASYGSLDPVELLELDWCFSQGQHKVVYSPIVLKFSHSYLHYETVTGIPKFTLENKELMRHMISQKCSNSFVKAKKKLIVEEDYDRYISLKSLFHSIRMSQFAYQYAKNGYVKINSCKALYDEICYDYENNTDEELLELINDKYKKNYNEKMRLFRLFYPK